MSERKNEKLANVMSQHEGPFRVTEIGFNSYTSYGLSESEVYQLYDETRKCQFLVYNANHVIIFNQHIL